MAVGCLPILPPSLKGLLFHDGRWFMALEGEAVWFGGKSWELGALISTFLHSNTWSQAAGPQSPSSAHLGAWIPSFSGCCKHKMSPSV